MGRPGTRTGRSRSDQLHQRNLHRPSNRRTTHPRRPTRKKPRKVGTTTQSCPRRRGRLAKPSKTPNPQRPRPAERRPGSRTHPRTPTRSIATRHRSRMANRCQRHPATVHPNRRPPTTCHMGQSRLLGNWSRSRRTESPRPRPVTRA